MHPSAFVSFARVTSFPYIRSAVDKIRFYGLLVFPHGLALRQLKFDGNFDPGFDRLAAGPRRDKAPLLDRFRRRVVEQVVTGAGIDLDGFGPAFFIDEHAQKHSAFFAFTPGAVRVVRLRSFAIARLS